MFLEAGIPDPSSQLCFLLFFHAGDFLCSFFLSVLSGFWKHRRWSCEVLKTLLWCHWAVEVPKAQTRRRSRWPPRLVLVPAMPISTERNDSTDSAPLCLKYQLLALVIRTSVILTMYLLGQKLGPGLNRSGKAAVLCSRYDASAGNWICYRVPRVVDNIESDHLPWVFTEVNFREDDDGSISEERSDLHLRKENGEDKIQSFQSVSLKHLLQTP